MGRRSIPPPPALADPAAYRWAQDLWRQLSSEQLIPSIRVITSSSTLSVTDYTLMVKSASTTTVTLLPASTVTYQSFYLKSRADQPVLVVPHGTDTVDTESILTLGSTGSVAHIQSNGTRWIVLGRW